VKMHHLARWAIAALILCGASVFSQTNQAQVNPNDGSGVREFVTRWNAAYTGLNPKALAALETPDFEFIDRFGHWMQSEGPAFNEQLWASTFKDIYHGRPGPEHTVEHIRILRPGVALVQAHANWGEITLDDGTRIPPHGEIATFVLVKDKDGWHAASLNIHNQMAFGTERPGEKPPAPAKPAPEPEK
jgi:uncharacterized protein (TIGR02246 family)